MSNSNDDTIQVFSSILTASFIEMATLTLTAYEYLITLDQEINLFWRRKMTGATLLFLATRYLALLAGPILGAPTFAPVSDQSCVILGYMQFVPSVMQDLVWAGFSGLRTLALSGMNWTLAAVVFALAACPFGINMWDLSLGMTGMHIERIGCADGNNLSSHLAVVAVAVARSCVITADALVITVTWRFRLTRDRTLSGITSVSSLGDILVTNGTIYFLVIVMLNTLHLTLTCLSIVDAIDGFSEVTTFTDPLTAILTWRFLLALQFADQSAVNQASLGTGYSDAENSGGSLRFASRVIGSAGASLAAGPGTSLFDVEALDGEDEEGHTYEEAPSKRCDETQTVSV